MINIYLRCPSCAYVWHATSVVEGAWWAPKYPEVDARFQCYCPKCSAAPPMELERTENQ